MKRYFAGERLRNFQIRSGFSLDLTQNPLCGEQGDEAFAAEKEFVCRGGPKVGRYLTLHRNDSAVNRELVLFEVVAMGGMLL